MHLTDFVKVNRTGLLIMVGVTISVFGAWTYNNIEKANRRQMAEELGSIGDIWGLPQINPANNKIAFSQRSENGLGLYECDEGQKPLLITETQQGTFNYDFFRVLGWTPDGQAFACARDGKLRTYDPESKEPTDEINIGGRLENFAWLSPNRIGAFNEFKLYDIILVGHLWEKHLCYTVTNAASITEGTGLSDHSFAWRQDNEIWMFNFQTGLASILWAGKTNPLVDYYFDPAEHEIYINCGTNGGLVYALVNGTTNSDLELVANFHKQSQYIFKVSKLNQGYAYLASNTSEQDIRPASPAKNKTLYLIKNGQSEPTQILGAREIVDYNVAGNALLIIGSMTNEPCGIWKYDEQISTLKSIWRPLPSPKFSTLVTPEYHTTTNGDGEMMHYYLWSPIKPRPGKKYSLMIGQSNYRWLAEAEVAANSGCYFAIAERPTFHSVRGEDWLDDVKATYNDLLKTKNIDAGRVFLFATSAETVYANELLYQEPNIWKGAFLEGGLGPRSFTDNRYLPKLAIILGNNDKSVVESALAYKEMTAKKGVLAEIVLRAGIHTALATSSQREIARLLVEFLHDNG